ncbi:MAG: aminopeptidase P family protein [Lachnoclostridium sp.]|nr:aminopeptidase P family protein [Lachnoclostridium sp.]
MITDRIAALREEMKADGVNAVIIPRTDPHLSEYIADHWHVVRYFSGFTGSAATLVVTLDNALLWTDSRYFLQAAHQLEGSGITLMKEGLPDTPSITEYLTTNLPKGDTVAIDGLLMSIAATDALRDDLARAGLKLRVDFTPVDKIWTDRPALPADKIFIHDVKYAGKTAKEKMAEVLADAAAQGATSVFISALDEIAWTLNLRSSDVPCNPVATSFLYLAADKAVLFIDPAKVTPEAKAALEADGVTLKAYGDVKEFLTSLPADAHVLLSATQSSGAVAAWLGQKAVVGKSAVAMLKAVKNATQIEGIRQAMKRDGVAMVRSLIEIEKLVKSGKKFTETDVADILLANRKKGDNFFDLSFDTIAGYGANGAIVHYSPDKATAATIKPGNLLLIDSGANYLDGTTDLTRTIAIGEPSDDMIHDFTLVMKGHIALATAIFPEGTRGAQLDAFARMPLWKEGKSYLHGTGHGVGHFLNVHEGPQSIRLNDTLAPLTPGMLTSNEPGLYLADRYGIRCENLVLTVPCMETEFGRFFQFETMTLCPFDRNLFNIEEMTEEEIDWVDSYHAMVWTELSPLLNDEEKAWLREATKSLLILEL